jgi:hypothetical protein
MCVVRLSVKRKVPISSLGSDSTAQTLSGRMSWVSFHEALNHASLPTLRTLASANPDLTLFGDTSSVSSCPTCIAAKFTQGSFHSIPNQSSRPGESLYADICVLNSPSRWGFSKFLVVVDEFSRFTFVRLLRTGDPSGTASSLLIHVAQICSNMFGRPVSRLRTDNEFRTTNLASFTRSQGISHTFTTIDTSQQNGIAERAIRSCCDGMRAALAGSSLQYEKTLPRKRGSDVALGLLWKVEGLKLRMVEY